MKTNNKANLLPTTENSIYYKNLSLIDLIKRIVEQRDRQALDEFHTRRTIFNYKAEGPYLFIEYLQKLKKSAQNKNWLSHNQTDIAARAYDITLDRFNNLSAKKNFCLFSKSHKKLKKAGRNGPDCHYYFKSFADYTTRLFKKDPPNNQLDEEKKAAIALQGFVRRQFYRSSLEAQREANKFWSRYNWKVKGETICVWLPVSIKSRQRRIWLENHISLPEPSRPGERQRIQKIIDQNLVKEILVPMEHAAQTIKEHDLQLWGEWKEGSSISLGIVVADEKARTIHRQAPAIKQLGKIKLQKMILNIFSSLQADCYHESNIAGQFSLSRSTFSRFAGLRWHEKEKVPALWRNTASVLSSHPAFKETVISMGYEEAVKNALIRNDKNQKGQTHE